jgi:hypothetical protein
MSKLGWQYEHGLAGPTNADEAVRCYFKAARLGSPWALSRLTPPPPPPGDISNPSSETSGSRQP